jgi:hypothetical protein
MSMSFAMLAGIASCTGAAGAGAADVLGSEAAIAAAIDGAAMFVFGEGLTRVGQGESVTVLRTVDSELHRSKAEGCGRDKSASARVYPGPTLLVNVVNSTSPS